MSGEDARLGTAAPDRPLFTVVVCTHNRAELLAGALASLAGQTLDPARFEVLVVDNRSTETTARVVAEAALGRARIRRVEEPRLGLAHARNRGWREALGDWLGYTDDDCHLPPGWLEAAHRVAVERAPAVFGGPYRPFYLGPRPAWFKDAYGSASLGDRARPLVAGETLPGGNLFVRRGILAGLGGFDAGLGMAGRRIAYAEESELQLRLQRDRPECLLWYEPALEVEHLVRPEKMRTAWLVRRFVAKGRSIHLLHRALDRSSREPLEAAPPRRFARARLVAGMAKTLAALGADVARHGVIRDRRLHPDFRNYLFERGSDYLRTLGRQRAQLELLAPGREGGDASRPLTPEAGG